MERRASGCAGLLAFGAQGSPASRRTVRALIQKPLRSGQGPCVSAGFRGTKPAVTALASLKERHDSVGELMGLGPPALLSILYSGGVRCLFLPLPHQGAGRVHARVSHILVDMRPQAKGFRGFWSFSLSFRPGFLPPWHDFRVCVSVAAFLSTEASLYLPSLSDTF